MRYHIIFAFLFIWISSISAQSKYEVRATWLTTAYGLDWPHTRANTAESIQKQKDELIEILDRLYDANFNTVLFQVRTRGDVFYQSSIEPYNALLTGRTGGNPGYDPLAFAIEECHKRGMECHAWMVAIPLGSRKHVNSLGKQSIVHKQPGICVSYLNSWYLNPGHPETKVYLMSMVREIVSNYDIDGVHFDYLRYPERALKFPDSKEHRRFGKGKEISQWRRDNLTEIVRYLYRGTKEIKPWVKVSTSPVGKYRDTSRYTSRSWNAYHTVFQDVQGWLAEGIQDQVYPMMYFRKNNFYPFALDWQEQCCGRHIIPGLGVYFLDPREGNWTIDEVERQINFVRTHGLAGQAYYRTEFLMDNTQGIMDRLTDTYYIHPALQPPIPWLDTVAPTAPTSLTIHRDGGYTTLNWASSSDNDDRNEPMYVLYGSDAYPVDTTDPANIIAQRIRKTSYIYAPVFPWLQYEYYAVTAVDRYGNESEAVQLLFK